MSCRALFAIGLSTLTLAADVGAQTDASPPPADTAQPSPPAETAPPPTKPATPPAPKSAPSQPPPAASAPTQPPPGYAYPPPGYAYPPPPGYYPVPYAVPVQRVEEPPRWHEGEPAPPGYRVESRPDVKTIRSGVGMLVGFWIISVITGAVLNEAEKSDDGDDVEPGDWSVLYWPVAGPFLAMNNVSTSDAGWAFLLLDGIFQSVGVIAIGIGIASHEERLVRNEARLTPSLRVVPTVNQAGAGVGLLGHF